MEDAKKQIESIQLTLIDLDTGTETLFCSLPSDVGGLTTSGEFTPPNECAAILDLDLDDSSGAIDFDYNAPDFSCLSNSGISIADVDVNIESSDPIDQMSISIIAGIQDPGSEFLELLNAPNIQIIGSGTTNLTLVNLGNAVFNDFITALNNTSYQNTAPSPSPGLREVQSFFTTTNAENSNLASTFINVVQLPDVSVDLGSDIEVCPDETALVDAGSGNGYSYLWSTTETTQTIQVSSPGQYSVTVNDGINCPGDDLVQVSLLPEYSVSISGVPGICETEVAFLIIETDAPGLIDVVVDVVTGPPIELLNISNGFSFPIVPLQTSTYSVSSVTPLGFNACFEFGNPYTVEVFSTYVLNEAVSICEGESILLAVYTTGCKSLNYYKLYFDRYRFKRLLGFG